MQILLGLHAKKQLFSLLNLFVILNIFFVMLSAAKASELSKI
jgi:hypothetical protein